MNNDIEVLIIGGGPTGLMLGCQLLRFGISFRIFDKQADRAHESRALAVQAKSMEIFQNLGLADEFLAHARSGTHLQIFINGKPKLKLKFENVTIPDTPFPAIYFISQSETEKTLLKHLEKNGINVERQTTLISFLPTDTGITANIQHELSGKAETINCRYIVGCDGAHSAVRHILDIPFEGASYEEEFMLADAKVIWPEKPEADFMGFFDKKGIFLQLPLENDLSRVMGARIGKAIQRDNSSITAVDLQKLGQQITHKNIQLSNVIWITHFYLHHRLVKSYQKGNAFLAGDAAHIHSPVGGQGMNTGLQDATNLAWKIAFVIKNKTSTNLLATYTIERHRIGEILLKTTDRIFSVITANNFVNLFLRTFMLSMIFMMPKIAVFRQRLFRFISQLGIHYHDNEFVYEKNTDADTKFLKGPAAGCRAPDAPYGQSTLFEIFGKNPCNILIFQSSDKSLQELEQKISALEKPDARWIKVHRIIKSPATQLIFDRYGVSTAAGYFIRPDGYIGFRMYGENYQELLQYIEKFYS